MVQKHAARRLHYDFRLEWAGTLKSWAVPGGPSFDPEVKRLAVEVEDHPVEYADFEGVIPAGNYGAGKVIVWDLGRWRPVEPVEEGLTKGKLLFDLQGYKLRGRWQLVRTKRPKNQAAGKQPEWLLIKKPDAFARKDGDEPPPEAGERSVLSGLSLDEMGRQAERAAELRSLAEGSGAPAKPLAVEDAEMELAVAADQPFSRAGWVFEVKYDGFRALAAREGARAKVIYRSGSDATEIYPDLARGIRALPAGSAILDGEICVLDPQGRPTFNLLQQRALLTKPADVERAAVELPATLYVFDLLALEGHDLRALPLVARKRLLVELLPKAGALRFAEHFEQQGEALYREAVKLGFEGVVGKRADSPYRGGRQTDWVKVRAQKTRDFAVVGYTPPKGARAGFGALHLAELRGGKWIYVGRVGSGFDDKELRALGEELDRARVKAPPCEGPLPTARGQVWVRPEIVVEVKYHSSTGEGLLRQPTFVRLRRDKRPEECLGDEPLPDFGTDTGTGTAASETEPAPAPGSKPESKIKYSNLTKVFWPRQGYTKGDLIDYYRNVGKWIVPYLKDRPIVVTRYPDGVDGKSFYQHNAPEWTPSWVRRERIWSDAGGREVDYYVCDDLEMLLYVVNSGAIPLHTWAARVRALTTPDWSVIDLDPKGAPMAHMVQIALALKALCDGIGLPSHLKTSGASGLHVMVPLGGQCTHEQSRQLALLLSRLVERELPDIATTVRQIEARKGRVYLDYGQNGPHRTVAGPLSARPVEAASVSMPLPWDEVVPDLDPTRFTIKSAPALLEKHGDPLAPVLSEKPDLARALERLIARTKD